VDATSRYLLYAITGVRIPVLATNQPYKKCNFQSCDGQEMVNERDSMYIAGLF